MISRERVLLALNHIEPDRVPFFYRDVPEAEFHVLKELGLSSRDELLEYLGVDFRWVGPGYVGPKLFDPETGIKRDIWGIEYKYVKLGERNGYWETVSNPLAECKSVEELEEYEWPRVEWFDFSVVTEKVRKYKDYAIMTEPGFASPSLFQCPVQGLLGQERAFMDVISDSEFFEAMVEKVLEFQLPFIDMMLEAGGGRIDLFRIGDDFGTQRGLLMSPVQWRKALRPGLKAMCELAENHHAHIYMHSCGAVRDLIPDLLELGVEVLDPLQVTAHGMVPAELKEAYGDKLCFSGGVDEQHLLREGDERAVCESVVELLDDMAKGGGFFIGPTHNFEADIPVGNILAMYRAAGDWSQSNY
ncbi:methylcobalamin:coenzyme M methyltransferase [Anaerohalosphaera lusitana]|uniref:Methylcobalamin:coenzyme M methyltransferase n=1 Tax=Anaerohalosphaera lusitana TaxID=1936003 RepID=A0A1U9NLR3_9BACT|nr:uroporphyrinogen decarboxylase family protein [Anaerohalosphaera lusitana]AQT68678.1 methylcobalamin:coenzyme M methyltransferase [Anaerohalosphaera lusitana]